MPHSFLIEADAAFPALDPGAPHRRCTHEAARGYPPRAPVGCVAWSEVDLDYRPTEFTSERVRQQPAYADPAEPAEAARQRPGGRFHSLEACRLEPDGVTPRNPRGRTGMIGRGALGKWGANQAADPLVTRCEPQSGRLEIIAIQRNDSGQWALPGGMADEGEDVAATLARELAEEALGSQAVHWQSRFRELFARDGRTVYSGYVDDPRNTDQAWMETHAVHLHLEGEAAQLELTAGDDAGQARWTTVDAGLLDRMYANHGELVGRAVQLWQAEHGLQVSRDGQVYPAG